MSEDLLCKVFNAFEYNWSFLRKNLLKSPFRGVMKILLFIKTLKKFNVTDRTLKFNLPSNLWENWNNIIYSILSKKRIFTCSIVEEIHSGKKKDYRLIFTITKIWDRKTWRKSTLIGPIEFSLLFFQKFTCNKKFNFKKTLSKVFCIKVIKHRKKINIIHTKFFECLLSLLFYNEIIQNC